MSGPLDWLTVVDVSEGLAGGFATGLLADYGADVIRVERPGGDPYRSIEPVAHSVLRRGTRSIELDLKKADDRAVLDDLLAGADVFVHSWAPGVPERLGYDFAELHEAHPSLICAAITAFGQEGSHSDLAAHDAIVHAIVGTMGEQDGYRDGPIYEAQPFASQGAGYLIDIAILSALYRRHIDGVGRYVETSLYDGALAYLMMLWGMIGDESASWHTGRGKIRQIVRPFICKDGEYLSTHTGALGAWGRMIRQLGLEDRIGIDPAGLDMGILLTEEEQRIIDAEVPDIIASKTRDEWLEIFKEIDVCAVEHFRPTEAYDAPQVVHNELIVTVDDPQFGEIEQVGPAIKLEKTPGTVRRPAPTVGEHSAQIRAELASASAKEPAQIKQNDTAVPPLEGLKILDVGSYYAGPWASRVLADLGADVIKLETTFGDPLRGQIRIFHNCQAGKRSVAFDLKNPKSERLRDRLSEWADVVHHNMRPGAAERIGFGVEQVRKLNPEVVYQQAMGWGSTGPDKNRQSFAPMQSGYAGQTFEVAGRFNDPIYVPGNEDPGAGLLGAVGILLGVVHQQRTGQGQVAEVPQLNVGLAHTSHIVRRKADKEPIGAGRLDTLQLGFGPTNRLFETEDGWIVVVAETDEEVAALERATGISMASGARPTDSPGARWDEDEAEDLADQLTLLFGSMTTAQALEKLKSEGVPAVEPVPYNGYAFLTDPENVELRRAAAVNAPQGTIRLIDLLVRIGDVKLPPHRLAPERGAHTRELMAWAGYSESEIAEAEAEGIAWQAPV
ncbi:CoA transferase [Gordonia sp. HNM0687]|uniref:CoA transferase n=1 Tax=Gordonia mangrovi TaxID=2665643 RepID=A0A6L7GTY3_9ACTN|nr:CoA transferase [Gordonia mangrovi]MXP23396.1 CoA transferase [Gordonia mangrovi]UVF76701.1 CoA transferase [Gordonia mangrovi]